MPPDPLQAGEDRQFVAAVERQANLFNRREVQIGLGWEVMSHGCECLQIRSPKGPKRSNKVPTFARAKTRQTQCQRGADPFYRRHYLPRCARALAQAEEIDDEQYIVRLIGKVITMSLDTMRIIQTLHAGEFD